MNYLKKQFLLLYFLSCPFAQGQQIDSLLNSYYLNKDLIGIVAGVSVDGEFSEYSIGGFSNREDSLVFTQETSSRIASIVKPMTAVALMQLVEQGKCSLDDPIQKYLPEFTGENKEKITIRHLLNHTAGIPVYKNKKESANRKNYEDLEASFSIFKELALLFEPGTKYSYSTYGYVVLGVLIERISGLSYAQYMQQNIWNKASMFHTEIEIHSTKYPNKAKIYHLQSNGKIKKETKTNLSDRIPGGGVQSTLEDLLLFGEAIISNKLISEESLQLMLQDSDIEKSGNGYGLGFTLYGTNPKYGEIFGHSGSQIGASTMLFIVPQMHAVIVVISNTSGANQIVGDYAIILLNQL